MTPSLLVLEHWSWPWAPWTLHAAYLLAALLVAVHYVPQLRCAWRHPDAVCNGHSLQTWMVWAMCSGVSCAYGVFMLHNLVFLLVVSADFLGRVSMVLLILRARMLNHEVAPELPMLRCYDSIAIQGGLSSRANRFTHAH